MLQMVGPRFNDKQFSSSAAPGNTDSGEPAGIDAAKRLLDHVGELSSFASYYLATKLDATKAQIRNLVVMAALGVVGLVVFAGTLIVAAYYLLNGAADGLGLLLNKNYWAGDLIVGTTVFVLTGIVTVIALGKIKTASRQATVAKYEQLKNEQRRKFGHDVSERAVGG